MVQQAAESVQQASAASRFRQHVEFLNPVNEKAINFLSTEAMDYPCRLRTVLQPMLCVSLLYVLKWLVACCLAVYNMFTNNKRQYL